MYGVVLLVHILGATVWTGGHLVLAFVVLPRALRERAPEQLMWFEVGYERIGLPAFVLQVLTGLWLAHRLIPDPRNWLDVSNPIACVILVKLTLLLVTLGLAADARLRIVPNLSATNLRALAWHIVPVTIASVLFVAAGVTFRTGWFY
jgi:putative copper export protein